MASQLISPEVGEAPVFVAADGRVRARSRWLGRALAIALAAWLAAVVAGGTGFTSLPPLPTHVAARVDTRDHTTFVKLGSAQVRDRDGRI